ncbi:MAG: hypothetical protein RL141_1067 [Candidatus Parcubacteria bacterium]|jgi:Tfp pilus assembly protein PilO
MHEKARFTQQIIVACVVIVVTVAASWWCAALLWHRVEKQAAEEAERKALLASFQEARRNIQTLEAEYALVEPFRPAIQSALPNDAGLLRVVEALEFAAQTVGSAATVHLESQAVLPSAFPGVTYVPFRVVLEGDLSVTRAYLNTLEALPIFVSVDALTVEAPESILTGGSSVIKGKIYVR